MNKTNALFPILRDDVISIHFFATQKQLVSAECDVARQADGYRAIHPPDNFPDNERNTAADAAAGLMKRTPRSPAPHPIMTTTLSSLGPWRVFRVIRTSYLLKSGPALGKFAPSLAKFVPSLGNDGLLFIKFVSPLPRFASSWGKTTAALGKSGAQLGKGRPSLVKSACYRVESTAP